MKHQPWQTAILALSLILSMAGCGKEQKSVAASTNAPTGNVDKLKEQARNAVTTTRDYLAQQKGRWQELKTNAETAFADLEKSFKDTLSRFTNDDKSAKP